MTHPLNRAPRLAVEGLTKRFAGTLAVDGVDLTLLPGEIRAVVGENGAGKTTLMHLLSGAFRPDSGSMLLDGEPYSPTSPKGARELGVTMIHQELSLVPHLNVTENIFLGVEKTRLGLLGLLERKRMRLLAQAALAELGREDIDLDAPAGELPLATQQLAELARAIATEASVLILDEPTSSLSRPDVEALFALLKRLRDTGIGIFYISHFLEEVSEIGDSVSVLRDGRVAYEGALSHTSSDQIVEHMVGQRLETLFSRSRARTPGDVILTGDQLSGPQLPVEASFELRRGEVLGIAGLVGAGRSELLRVVFGLEPVRSGRIRFAAFEGSFSPNKRLLQGMGLLSEDRQGEGLATELSITDNLILPRLSGLGPLGTVLPARARQVGTEWIQKLNIQSRGPDQRVSELSGGNQQKLALARLMHQRLDVVLLDEPTRGVDIGAKTQIYRLIDKMALAGKAVLMTSSYAPELLGVCDRIAVMQRGRLGQAKPIDAWDEASILLASTTSREPNQPQ